MVPFGNKKLVSHVNTSPIATSGRDSKPNFVTVLDIVMSFTGTLKSNLLEKECPKKECKMNINQKLVS